VLLTAYLAARQNDLATARAALAVASRNTRDTGYPVLNHMRMVAEAQLAIAEGRAPDAIALLKPLLTGTEPYVSHVVLMDAYAAKTDYAAARCAWAMQAWASVRIWPRAISFSSSAAGTEPLARHSPSRAKKNRSCAGSGWRR